MQLNLLTKYLLTKYLLAAALALWQLNTQPASQAPVAADNGMVVTAQHLAMHVGVDVLKGPAAMRVDAAVAVGYALAVVYPAARYFCKTLAVSAMPAFKP